MLAGAAHSGNGVGVLAADDEDAALRKAVQVDDTAFVLLDDFAAVATAGTASELGGGGEGGVGENEDRGGGRLGAARTVDQTTGIISDGGLDDVGKRGEN